VLEKGQIVEVGTFEQLLEKGGLFVDLYQKQFVGQDI
jgi:ABC-type multidrug transport system fused ATPase/permease subunit